MKKPIRVLHVFGRLDAGGAESRTMDIYRSINREKIQFDFAIHTEDKCFFTDEVISLGGRIYSFPRFNGKNYCEYKKAWKHFFINNPEYRIIHGHQTSTGFIYFKEAKKQNVSIRVAHARNANKDSIIKRYLTKLAKYYATDLFAVSKLAGISEFGISYINSGKVKIIPNAIETSKYSFNKDIRIKMRKELNLDSETLLIHIGRFHTQKNHMYLLKIFEEILKLGHKSKVLLVGDGHLRNEILSEIKKLNIENDVILAGIREDVPDLLQAADVLVFPSLYEGLPGVVLEAQASGLPCLISDTISSEVKITDLVKSMSINLEPELWANKLIMLIKLHKRKDMYDEIKEAGFDISSIANYYENFYIKSIEK